jgi:tripartite-type tricarboxylate transporter receptor subunit TctC
VRVGELRPPEDLAQGLGPAIVTALNREIVRIIQLPDVKKRWETLGAEALPMTPEQFDKYLSEQSQLVVKLVKAANIQAK